MKQCSKCKITYHESNFSKDRTHKDNLSSVCKDCRRDSTSEGKKMPKKRAPTGGKLQKPLGKKISYSQ